MGVNIIAKNLNLSPNDEVLTTDLEYGACDRTWDLFCENSKAIYKRQKITLPITTKEKFIEEVSTFIFEKIGIKLIFQLKDKSYNFYFSAEISEIDKQILILYFH